MSIVTPFFGIEAPSNTTLLNKLGDELETFAESIDTILHNFDYNGADPDLVLSRVTALESWRTAAQLQLNTLQLLVEGRKFDAGFASMPATSAGVFPNVTVNFTTDFDIAPRVIAVPSSPVASVGISNAAITPNEFTIALNRPGSTTTTDVQWFAVQL